MVAVSDDPEIITPTVITAPPTCPICGGALQNVPKGDGVHCFTCDMMGKTGVYSRGGVVVSPLNPPGRRR